MRVLSSYYERLLYGIMRMAALGGTEETLPKLTRRGAGVSCMQYVPNQMILGLSVISAFRHAEARRRCL